MSDRELYFGDFERDGEEAVRNNLAAGRYNEKRRDLAVEWTRRLDQARADAVKAAEMELTRRGTEAAESAAAAARNANRIAKDARNISYVAAAVALAGLALGFVGLLVGQ